MKLYLNVTDEIINSASLERLFESQIEIDVADDFDELNIFDYKCIDGELVKLTDEEKEEFYPVDHKAEQESLLLSMMLESMKESFLSTLTDSQALSIPLCFNEWETGVAYSVGDRVQYDGKLWKCRQAHTSQDGWQPSINTASLWETINETNQGTIDDPIPYDQTMSVYSGKYYLENGTKYKCIRDSGQPLYAPCSALVGNYFELA